MVFGRRGRPKHSARMGSGETLAHEMGGIGLFHHVCWSMVTTSVTDRKLVPESYFLQFDTRQLPRKLSSKLISGDERTNQHKQLARIITGMGGGVKFADVLPFSWANIESAQTQFPGNLGQMAGKSRDTPGTIP